MKTSLQEIRAFLIGCIFTIALCLKLSPDNFPWILIASSIALLLALILPKLSNK
jgi:hypothetical protein